MMRVGYSTLALIITIQLVFSSNVLADEKTNPQVITSGNYGEGYRYNIQGWVYIHIQGEPYERGYQYGFLAADEIIDVIERWSNLGHDVRFMKIFKIKSLPENYDKLSEKWWDICRTKSVKNFLKYVPEEFQQEMKGITDGVKSRDKKVFGRAIEYEDIVAAQFVQDVWYSSFKHFYKRFHPLRGLLNGVIGILSGELKNDHPGHCSAFIATGDATSNGQIVVAHSSIFNPSVAQRCNIILDVEPTDGHRFMMTAPPGSLWSQEDFYINEEGIVLIETELPQGPWKSNGKPKGVRSRTAIQYSSSIDEVIDNLMSGNNGLIPNEWLIGDTKTNEIASFEQALYNQAERRTTSGFYWSANVPHDEKVKRELFGIYGISKILPELYYKLWDDGRGEKFVELSDKYYGKIDIDIAKVIMSTSPICNGVTDAKITDSNMMKNMGFVAFMGIPTGEQWSPSKETKDKFKVATESTPDGWVKIYPSISKPNTLETAKDDPENKKTKVLWQFETEHLGNMNYSSSVVDENSVYSVTSEGAIYAISKTTGKMIWSKNVGKNTVEPVVNNNLLYVGTNDGLYAIDKSTGDIDWMQSLGKVFSKPVVCDNSIIASFSDGKLIAFNTNSGVKIWSYKFAEPAYISETSDKMIYIGSGSFCYGFNLDKKEVVWKASTGGPITASPKIKESTIYVGSWDGALYAINAKTGELNWKYETGWGVDSTPDVSGGLVFVGSLDNNFYALNKENGKVKWVFNCKSAIHSSPVVYGELVFFGCDDGRFYALDKESGTLAWSYTPGYCIMRESVYNYITTPIISNPVVKDGVVYFGAKGVVYALDAQTFVTQRQPSGKNSDIEYKMFVYIAFLVIIVVTSLIIYLKIKGNKEV